MNDSDLKHETLESAKDSFPEIVMKIGLAAFFVHGIVYLVLLVVFPDSIEGTEFAQNIFIPGFRFLDPGIWLFWFWGWLFIAQSLFLTRRHLFLVITSVALYAFSFVPTLIWGFMYGLGAVVGTGLLSLAAIWFGKKPRA